MEDQVDQREFQIMEHDQRKYLAQHIILSTTSMQVGGFIKDLNTMSLLMDFL